GALQRGGRLRASGNGERECGERGDDDDEWSGDPENSPNHSASSVDVQEKEGRIIGGCLCSSPIVFRKKRKRPASPPAFYGFLNRTECWQRAASNINQTMGLWRTSAGSCV